MSDAAEDPFHEQGVAAAAAPAKPVESGEGGVGLPTSSSSSLSSSLNRDAASRASASTGTSAADPSSALMSVPAPGTHDEGGEQEQLQPVLAAAAYPFSADPYPQDEEAIRRHQARSAEREAEYQARQQEDAVTSPPLPQLPADQDAAAPDGAAPKPRAQQQQQRVYQRPARDAIQVGRGTLSLWPPFLR